MARQKTWSLKSKVWFCLALELLIALGFVWNCYRLGGCQGELCVPTGSELGMTCLLVGLKVAGALMGATLVVVAFVAHDRRR